MYKLEALPECFTNLLFEVFLLILGSKSEISQNAVSLCLYGTRFLLETMPEMSKFVIQQGLGGLNLPETTFDLKQREYAQNWIMQNLTFWNQIFEDSEY